MLMGFPLYTAVFWLLNKLFQTSFITKTSKSICCWHCVTSSQSRSFSSGKSAKIHITYFYIYRLFVANSSLHYMAQCWPSIKYIPTITFKLRNKNRLWRFRLQNGDHFFSRPHCYDEPVMLSFIFFSVLLSWFLVLGSFTHLAAVNI